jgi:hypothetical protein
VSCSFKFPAQTARFVFDLLEKSLQSKRSFIDANCAKHGVLDFNASSKAPFVEIKIFDRM